MNERRRDYRLLVREYRFSYSLFFPMSVSQNMFKTLPQEADGIVLSYSGISSLERGLRRCVSCSISISGCLLLNSHGENPWLFC